MGGSLEGKELMKGLEKDGALESLGFVVSVLKDYKRDLDRLRTELRRETGRVFESRFEAFKNLSGGHVPEPVLNFTLYSFKKLERGLHIDNVDLIYDVLSSIEGIDERYLDLSKTLIDLLQQPIMEADDTLDHLPRNDMETISSEAIKAVNPALFMSTLINEAKKHPKDIDRFVKAGDYYLKNLGKLFGTPLKYIENKNIYLETSDKETEFRKLAETQILRSSHLRVYLYPIICLLDPQPSEAGVEGIAQLLERGRGINLLIKDMYDLPRNMKYNNYNSVKLILTKYKDARRLRSIVKTDMFSVGKLLFEDMDTKFVDIDQKYLPVANRIYTDAREALTVLERELEGFVKNMKAFAEPYHP